MNVCFSIVGDVVINNVTNPVNIQASGSDIRRHQNIDAAFLQSRDHLFTVFLRHITIERFGGVTSCGQSFSKFSSRNFSPDEKQYSIEWFDFQNSGQCIQFM